MVATKSASIVFAVLLVAVGACKSTDYNTTPRASAFGKAAIQEAITSGKLQHVYYDGDTLKAEGGFQFQRASIKLPSGAEVEGFRLVTKDGQPPASGVDVACSCDGMSSSGACTQIGSEPFGVTCGGSCEGCEAFVLF